MLRPALAEIAGVGLLADEIDQPRAAEVLRELPRCRLVDPHQRRMQLELAGHAERERGLHGANGVVAAIGIAGIVGLAHAADDVGDAAPVGQRRGEGQKYEIAAWHERVGQAVSTHLDRHIARQRGLGHGGQRRDRQRMALAELCGPIGAQALDALEQPVAAIELDGVALAVREAKRLHAREAAQRPGEAGGGILAAGEQHQRSL